MNIFLPERLNLSKHVIDFPPSKIPKFSADKLALILGQISSSSRHKKNDDGFVSLSSASLQSICREYRLYLDYARKTGIIQEDPQFIVGEKCRGFKFTDKYVSPIVRYVSDDLRMPKSLKRRFYGKNQLPKKHGFLEKPFNAQLLSIDERADEYFRKQFEYYRKHPDEIGLTRKGKRKDPLDKLNSAMLIIDKIQNHNYHLSIDHTSGRLHSPLTNMPKEMRHFLKYDGQLLFTADVSNSQPFIMLRILEPDFYFFAPKSLKRRFFPFKGLFEEDCVRTGIDDRLNLYSISRKVGEGMFRQAQDVESLFTLVNQFQSTASSEFQEFKNITTTGSYYDFIRTGLIEEVDPKFEDMANVKIECLRILFTSNKILNQKKAVAKKWFANHFNTIYDITCLYKKYDKRLFPVLLQSMESEIMLNHIARRINKERPDMPFFTIHDCLMSTQGNEEYIKCIMTQEFEKCIGAAPHLKLEFYKPDSEKIQRKPFVNW